MRKKKNMLLGIITVAILLVIVVGATFAYFTSQTGSGAGTDVNVSSKTTDSLTFNTEGEITIDADSTNFGMNAGNISDSAKASATLKANNATNSATENYDVYVYVSKNDFEYTTSDNTPELILTVTRPDGTEVKNVDGLEYVTVGDVSGLDITEYYGIITIANSHEITTTGTTTEDWNVTLTFVNLDSNQNANAGKTLTAELLIGQTSTVNEVCEVGSNLAGCLTTLADEKGYAFSNILKHDSTLALGANDNSYRYTGGDYEIADKYKNTYSKIDDELVKAYNVTSGTYKTHIGKAEEHYYFLAYDEETQYQNYGDAIAKAVEDGYITRNIDNYVCFGSNEEACPAENLYRIIGVFDNQVKLIKADYITPDELGAEAAKTVESKDYETQQGDYYLGTAETLYRFKWNSKIVDGVETYENDWSQASLKESLNGSYLTNLGTTWSSKIAYEDWHTGKTEINAITKTKKVYEFEQGENKLNDGDLYLCTIIDYATNVKEYNVTCTAENTMVNAQVGLMYLSEYGYAADQSYWDTPIFYYFVDEYFETTNTYEGKNNLLINHNWMYMGFNEWTIVTLVDNYSAVWINSAGGFNTNSAVSTRTVRPTFSLLTTITYQGGSGTIYDPIRIS